MNGVMTYLRTVRHLRPIQVYGRILFHLVRPKFDLSPPPQTRARSGHWVTPCRREPSALAAQRFVFLNEEHDLTGRGWDDPALAKLWRYHLHYFDDLNAQQAQQRVALHLELLRRWVDENQPGRGTGWEPYPTSLRIVNWIKWALAGNELAAECIASLAVQVRWLARRLERHLLGNHLLANAKALVFAGSFFEGAEADSWLETGRQILLTGMREQILDDGGHFERSPMYHALLLEDILDLLNLRAVYHDHWGAGTAALISAATRMRSWLAAMNHPDGEIAFFNDAAFDIAPPLAALEAYAGRLGFAELDTARQAVLHLESSGYIRIESPDALAILDVAPVSGGYLCAHGHADTLSFELSLFGRRVVVNSGTSRYGQDSERLRQRGTAAHNTVIVNGENSSEVWGGFRVARRAQPFGLSAETGSRIEVTCSHDGYQRLAGKPTHTRRWSFEPQVMTVEDTITGRFTSAEARFYLHPHVQVIEANDRALVLELPGKHTVRLRCHGGVLTHVAGTWHPAFGRSVPNTCLVARFEGRALRTRFDWSGSA